MTKVRSRVGIQVGGFEEWDSRIRVKQIVSKVESSEKIVRYRKSWRVICEESCRLKDYRYVEE